MVLKKLKHGWLWFGINSVGLSIAVACVIIVYLYSRQELSFDRFHSKSDRIFRVTTDSNRGAVSMHPARVFGDWPEKLLAEYPSIEEMARLVPFRNAIVKIENQKFYSTKVYATDSSFFKVFDFKILAGNKDNMLTQPGRAVICRSLALKYFGKVNVMGEKISIMHQQDPELRLYTIEGVMDDFPVNSHFHAELLTSYINDNDKTTWAYTYFLVNEGTNIDTLRNTIQQKWEKEQEANTPVPILYFQKLTDIHLLSHKTREMEKSGDMRSLIMLITGALIILFIAYINFLNLSRVRFLADFKAMKVKMINGASKGVIALEITAGSLLLSTISIIAGLLLAIWFTRVLQLNVFNPGIIAEIGIILVLITASVCLIALYPLYTSKIVTDTEFKNSVFQPPKSPKWGTFTYILAPQMGDILLSF